MSIRAPFNRTSFVAMVAGLLLLAAFVVLAVFSGPDSGLSAWDHRVADAFTAWRTPARSHFFWALTLVGNTPILASLSFAVILLFLAWGRWSRAAMIVIGLLMAWGISEASKAIVGRNRPPAVDSLIALPASHSMPSGHALTTLVFLGILVFFAFKAASVAAVGGAAVIARAAAWTALIAAIVVGASVGLSRVYLGVHWFSDVLAGWCLGGTWLLVLLGVIRPRLRALRFGWAARVVRGHVPVGPVLRVAVVVFLVLLCLAVAFSTAKGDPLLVGP